MIVQCANRKGYVPCRKSVKLCRANPVHSVHEMTQDCEEVMARINLRICYRNNDNDRGTEGKENAKRGGASTVREYLVNALIVSAMATLDPPSVEFLALGRYARCPPYSCYPL